MKRKLMLLFLVMSMCICAYKVSVKAEVTYPYSNNYSVWQSDYTAKTATIEWDSVDEALYYDVYLSKNGGQQVYVGSTTDTTYKFKNLKNTVNGNVVYIKIVYERDGFRIQNQLYRICIYVTPKKMAPPTYKHFSFFNVKPIFEMPHYEIELSDLKGKIVQDNDGLQMTDTAFMNGMKDNRFYKLRVRATSGDDGDGSVEVCGKWSNYKYVANQVGVTLSFIGEGTLIEWTKVKGASYYEVYASNNMSSGYKKLYKTKYPCGVITTKNCKNIKLIDDLYIYVTACKKVGKKVYKSETTFAYYMSDFNITHSFAK